ncbi:MAG: MFS transporter [Acidobacteriia bacterium]|nr:MFS transporter [Terriglobia bacterium]
MKTQTDYMRWVALSAFMLASSLSFLDRQILAALAVTVQGEFQLSAQQYGYLLSIFSITYALASPLAGWWIDRVGLDKGITVSIGLWSLAGLATGFVSGFPGLMACRAALGFAESGGIPASGKAVAVYLRPQERALGSAFGQIGISIGMVAAPVLATGIAVRYGWRAAFIVAGLLGFLWIPMWWFVSRKIPANPVEPAAKGEGLANMLQDPRLLGLVAANILGMTTYSLWMNWTTVFLVRTQGLTQQEANLRFAWIPPLFAALGGLAGGAISLRFARGAPARKGQSQPSMHPSRRLPSGLDELPFAGGVSEAQRDLPAARRKAALIAAVALLATAAAPHLPTTALATAVICWSFFWSVAFSVNLYALPLDYFGASRAASGIACLTFAYGLMQTVLSPAIGGMIDHYGFAPVCALVSALPLCAWATLQWTGRPA